MWNVCFQSVLLDMKEWGHQELAALSVQLEPSSLLQEMLPVLLVQLAKPPLLISQIAKDV